MRFAFFLLLIISAQAATLTIDPPVIYDCTGTHGKATIRWKGASGPVQLRVGPSREVFTGFGDTSGAAETGVWVGDGLEFILVNQQGTVEAFGVARVACNTSQAPANGIVSESYFPLELGNQWTYRYDSRIGTADYVSWTVTGQQTIGGRLYAEITSTVANTSSLGLLLREESGVLYRLIGTVAAPREEVYLNPNAASHAPFRNALGSYPDAASQNVQTTLNRESQVFVRGVGLARSRNDLLTGSSGGFVSGMELVDFRLATGPRVEAPITPRISVSIEKTSLDITGKQLTNCAIPCYYAACGIGSPVDPPGTYKPCARTRIEAAAEGDFQVDLWIITPTGSFLFQAPPLKASGETTRYVQVPLYSEPNKPLPPGVYILNAGISRGQGNFAGAAMYFEIR